MIRLGALLTAFAIVAAAQPQVATVEFFNNKKASTEKLRKALALKDGDTLPPDKVILEERLEHVDGVLRSNVEAVCCEQGKAILYIGIEERNGPKFEFRDENLPGEESLTADELLGDLPLEQKSIDKLQFAVRDPDPIVRRAAVSGLVKMARQIPGADPDVRLDLQPTWLIEMLNSIVYSDRQAALDGLLALTEQPNALLLAKIRERAFPALVEMAGWRTLEHALPAYLLLCRVAGVSKEDAESGWSRGEREKVVALIVKPPKGKKPAAAK